MKVMKVMNANNLADPANLSAQMHVDKRQEAHRHKTAVVVVAPTKKDEHWVVKKSKKQLKKISVFGSVKVAQLLCVIYILVLTFSPVPVGIVDPESGNIISPNPEDTANGFICVNGNNRYVIAVGSYQKICLAISRMSAFSMFPVLVAVFLTKCRAIHNFLLKTHLSLYVVEDVHELHIYAGRYIAFDVWVHTLFHLLRWGSQGNISLLWTTRTGLTGLVVVIATPLITFPMMYWRKSISYEVRKGLHYLFYLFAITLCWHVPTSAVPNGGFIAYVLGSCICIYTLDAAYVYLFMTEKIDTTNFRVLPSGVVMTMPVSDRFQRRGAHGGYVYVNLPWVDKNQWHAFSLFENPVTPDMRQVFMEKTGDWTDEVHTSLQRNTVRPVWVTGPFETPYSRAEKYDNEILVASGCGITPALSVIRAHKGSRRINLIWATRDPVVLEFFLENMYLEHDGWNLIFYSGRAPLSPAIKEINANAHIIKGRPQLCKIIPNIIYGIETKLGIPENYGAYPDSDKSQGLHLSFKPWETHEEAAECVKGLDKKRVLSTWGLLYSGSTLPIIKALTKISEDYDVALNVESYAW